MYSTCLRASIASADEPRCLFFGASPVLTLRFLGCGSLPSPGNKSSSAGATVDGAAALAGAGEGAAGDGIAPGDGEGTPALSAGEADLRMAGRGDWDLARAGVLEGPLGWLGGVSGTEAYGLRVVWRCPGFC